MPKRVGTTIAALSLISLFSCAPSQPGSLSSPGSAALEKRIAETNEKLDQLYQRVSTLQLMVDEQQRERHDLKNAGGPLPGSSISEVTLKGTSPSPPAESPPLPVTKPPEKSRETGSIESASDAESLYKKAYGLFEKKEYKSAAEMFDTLAARYPNHGLADNALYWAGECRFALKDYPGALLSFNAVLKRYPNGNKVSDALLKAGFCYLAIGDKENGIDYLKKTITNYPFSTAAPKAEAKLKQIQ